VNVKATGTTITETPHNFLTTTLTMIHKLIFGRNVGFLLPLTNKKWPPGIDPDGHKLESMM
jgi:hypothetical protein